MKKTDKFKELSVKSPDELSKVIHDSRKELMNLRFQKVSSELKNTSRVKVVRRTIAQVKTVLNTPKLANKLGEKNA